MRGGIYRRTEYWVYCCDPHGTCPLNNYPGEIDCWVVEEHGPYSDFVKNMRDKGWHMGRGQNCICPDCLGEQG